MGLDPQALLNMSPEEIEEQIKRQSRISKGIKRVVDSDDDDDDEEKNEVPSNKKGLMKMLLEQIQKNKMKKKGLDVAVSDAKKNMGRRKKQVESESDNNSSSDEPKKSSKNKSQSKKNRNVTPESDDSDVELRPKITKKQPKNVRIESDSDDSEPSKKSKEQTKPQSKKQDYYTIKIKPDEDEPEYFNDYMIEFNKSPYRTYKNVTDIKITNSSMPKLIPKINDTCNSFKISVGDEIKAIELAEDDYTLNEIVDGINDSLESVGIVCKVDKKGKVIIEQTDGDEFELDCSENSFAPFLGFTSSEYTGKSKYTSEESNKFEIKQIYLYISNVSKEPFAKIDREGKLTQLYNLSNKIDLLDYVVIQFRNSITADETDLYKFGGKTHNFTLSIKADK
jgi:hypothetical protein